MVGARSGCILVCSIALLAWNAACVQRRASVGLWFDGEACVLRRGAMDRFGDVLTQEERRTIEVVARAEVERAFSTVQLKVTSESSAFWKIGVVRSLPARTTRTLPRAGESVALGMLGGGGAVACDVVAGKAVRFAPPTASRADVVDAIGRGVGRTAVHEVVHQVLGPSSGHNDADTDSYEHGSSDRASQYYGELHWTTALPSLQQKFGSRAVESMPAGE